MISLRIFAAFLLALALNGVAWAEIYETTDADGNPEFTDSPPDGDSQVVDLHQTNVADTPTPQLSNAQQSDPVSVEQQRVNDNNPVIIHDANAKAEDARLKRLKDYESRHSATPYEVGDSDSQMPHEVGDSDSQMPHEVGDSDSQMPHEVGDSDSQMPHEVGDSDSQMPHEVGDSDSQMPHEVGDFTEETPEDYEGYLDTQPTEGQRVHHRAHRR